MTTRSKPVVVIDTNIFISAVIRGGAPHKLLEAWESNKFELLTSVELFKEMAEVLSRDSIFKKYHLTPDEVQHFLDGIKLNAVFAPVLNIEELPVHSRDPKDNIVIACVVAGKADYLVTGDEDLLSLNGNPDLNNLKIITVKEFLIIVDAL